MLVCRSPAGDGVHSPWILIPAAKQEQSSLPCPKAVQTHAGAGSQRSADLRLEIPTVFSEEASPATLETLAGVLLISHAGLLKQEDRAL